MLNAADLVISGGLVLVATTAAMYLKAIETRLKGSENGRFFA